jgi:hypothetical protein
MDFHEDLKLPDDDIAQIADDARHERADEFGVRQVELYHNPDGKVYCLLEAPDEEAVRKHHAALGVDCGVVHRVDGIT